MNVSTQSSNSICKDHEYPLSQGENSEKPAKMNWVLLIENLLSNQPAACDHRNRQECLNQAITQIKQPGSLPSNLDFQHQVDVLASDMFNLYESLSLEPLSKETRPQLSLTQQRLVLASLAVEIERFPLSFKSLKLLPEIPKNRYFSQVAFLNYLNSEEGEAIIQGLSDEMSTQENIVFSQTIALLRDLSRDYLTILSYIAAILHCVETLKPKGDDKIWARIESCLSNILQKISENNHDFLIPLGWSFPQGKLGHHFLVLVEGSDRQNEAVMRIVDTAQRCHDEMPDRRTNRQTSFQSDQISEEAPGHETPLEKPYPLRLRKCNQAVSTNKLADKINRLVKILMLQIPDYTRDYCEKLTAKKGPLNPGRLQSILSQINYSLVEDEIPLVDDSSPLASWNWFPANACAFSSFQPLFQVLALKVAKRDHIELAQAEALNLRHYFEVLRHSHKLFLLKNFKIDHFGGDDLKALFTAAVRQTIAESGQGIATFHRRAASC